MTKIKRLAAILLMLCVTAAACPLGVSALEGFETNNCIVFVSEPGETSPFVYYYKGGEQQSTDVMTWVDGGVHGKALQLDGTTEYLSVGYYQTLMSEMTFSTWIKFQGAVDPANPASAYWQRLITLAAGDQNYFTVSPHAVDPTLKNAEGGVLDGVYMEYYRGISDGNSEPYSMKAFEPSRENYSHYGLPQNEWHHMAVVADNMSVKVYVDGVTVLEEVFLMSPAQMNVDALMVGKGIWGNAPLHAQLDDTMLFDKALNADQIAALMQNGDAAVVNTPSPSISTTAPFTPTAPVTTLPQMDMEARNDDKPLTVFGLEMPLWGVMITAGFVGFLLVMILIVNLYELYWRKKHNRPFKKKAKKAKNKKAAAPVDVAMDEAPSAKPEGEVADRKDEEPSISIKAAALQKRMEEHARFLAEEEEEKKKASENAENNE